MMTLSWRIVALLGAGARVALANPPQVAVNAYGQCGGIGYVYESSGAQINCPLSYTCSSVNPYFHQCLPATSTGACSTVTIAAPTVTVTIVTTVTAGIPPDTTSDSPPTTTPFTMPPYSDLKCSNHCAPSTSILPRSEPCPAIVSTCNETKTTTSWLSCSMYCPTPSCVSWPPPTTTVTEACPATVKCPKEVVTTFSYCPPRAWR